MPPKVQVRRIDTPPLLPALVFLLAPALWFPFEYYALKAFEHGSPVYDWEVESLSDLGVDYRQVHPLKHHNVTSVRHASQNFNFMQAGVCFGLAQLALLFATRKRATQQTALPRTLRLVMGLLYGGGMILLAKVHGGPREKHWKIIGWHWLGFNLAAVAGNLNSILSAAVPSVGSYEANILYRAVSAALGLLGLYSFYQFQTVGEWDYQSKLGLWQRGTVYPVLAWEAVTAISLIAANFSNAASKWKRA